MSTVSRVDHVLTKETSRNRFSTVSWPISTSYMLISQRISFTPQCHYFYARDSQHYKLMGRGGVKINRLVCRYAQTARRWRTGRVCEPDASTRAYILQRQVAAYRSRPLRTPPDVVVYRTNPTQWTQCVHGQSDANRSRRVRASGKIASVNTAVSDTTYKQRRASTKLLLSQANSATTA